MVPQLPVLPKFPKLTWSYQNGLYCLSETDADRLLDYKENSIPLYEFQIQQYREQLKTVLDGIVMDKSISRNM